MKTAQIKINGQWVGLDREAIKPQAPRTNQADGADYSNNPADDYCRIECPLFVAELAAGRNGYRVAVAGCSLLRRKGIVCSTDRVKHVMRGIKPGSKCPSPYLMEQGA